MSETVVTRQESTKVFPNEEAARTGCCVVRSSDAMNFRLPDNYTVVQMTVLDKPEPIKHRRS